MRHGPRFLIALAGFAALAIMSPPASAEEATERELLKRLIDEVTCLRKEVRELRAAASAAPAAKSTGSMELSPTGGGGPAPVAPEGIRIRTLDGTGTAGTPPTDPQRAGAPNAGPTYRTVESQPVEVGRSQPLGIPLFGFAGAGAGRVIGQRDVSSQPLDVSGTDSSTQVLMDSNGLIVDRDTERRSRVDQYMASLPIGAADVTGRKAAAREARLRLSTARGREYFDKSGMLPAYRYVPDVSRIDYLTADGHSLPSVEWSAEGQDDLPRFFLESVSQGPAYYAATSEGTDTKVSDGQFAVVAPKGKFSLVGSSARNRDLAELQRGAAHPHTKGFSSDAILADNQFNFGNVWGNLSGEYYPDPDSGESEFRLRTAFADYRIDNERVVLALGQRAIPFGLYGASEWDSKWVWAERPIVYGRFFSGRLESPGVHVAVRTFDRDDRDFILTGGMYNASNLPSFFDGNQFFGGHVIDDHGRYDFGDLAFFGRAMYAVDFHHGCRPPFVAQLGGSVLYGPNGTGDEGNTTIYAAHLRVFRMFDRSKTPEGFVLEAEAMRRDLVADDNPKEGQDREFLRDEGFWVSGTYAFRNGCSCRFPDCGQWTIGGKYERVTGLGGNLDGTTHTPRNDDPYRDDRSRVSAFIGWNPLDECGPFLGHFKFVIEWNWDEAAHLDDGEHTIVFGIQVN